MPQTPSTLLQPRYQIVREFPVTTLAPYVGLSNEALEWCADNCVSTVADALRTMRSQGRYKVIKCPPTLQNELKRLINPPGIPADWPLHPDLSTRIIQQFAHTKWVEGYIRRAISDARDPWAALMYLVHFEEDLLQYKGVASAKLPLFLAWRDDMRKRHPKPKEVLAADCLKDENPRTTPHPVWPPIEQKPRLQPAQARSRGNLTITVQLDLDDPLLEQKFLAIKAIIG